MGNLKKKAVSLILLFVLSLSMFVVLQAEAATQNSITKLEIKKYPKNNTMQAGGSYNFDPNIVACETKGKATTDVVYFEISPETNTAGAECLTGGYAYPACAGEFQIRAVAFASKKDYQSWLKAKEKNGGKETAASKKYITAASDWKTIKVTAKAENQAIVMFQTQLTWALNQENIKEIVIASQSAKTFSIPSGDYSDKVLIVRAPKARVVNMGTFGQINIESVKGNNYFEKSKGNNVIYITATGININIKAAKVKEIIVAPAKENKRLRLTCTNGSTIEKIRVLEKITLIVDGNSKTELPVEVNRAADGAIIEAAGSIKLHTILAAALEEVAIDEELTKVSLEGNYYNYRPIYNFTTPENVHMFAKNDGTLEVLAVQNTGSKLSFLRYLYDSDFSCIGQKEIILPYSVFGGIYCTEDEEYYVVTGQDNQEEDDSKVVYCVTKFSSDWEERNRVTVSGGETRTVIPFDAGSCRMEMCGDDLVIYTSRERYTSGDGNNHQSNMIFILDTPTMQMRHVGELFPYNHVSHSFNQFVKFDGTNLFYVDHGDAYPRSVCIQTHHNFSLLTSGSGVLSGMSYDTLTEYDALPIYGAIGENYTGTTVNGFELGKSHNIIAGISVNHPEMTAEQWEQESFDNTMRNVYVILADKSGASSELVWLTDYDEEDTRRPRNLRMLKLDEDCFVLIYRVDDIEKSAYFPERVTAYQVIDSNGNVLEQGEFEDYFSATVQPIVYDEKIVWVEAKDYKENEFQVLYMAEEY